MVHLRKLSEPTCEPFEIKTKAMNVLETVRISIRTGYKLGRKVLWGDNYLRRIKRIIALPYLIRDLFGKVDDLFGGRNQ